jgi:hypothetical protein
MGLISVDIGGGDVGQVSVDYIILSFIFHGGHNGLTLSASSVT